MRSVLSRWPLLVAGGLTGCVPAAGDTAADDTFAPAACRACGLEDANNYRYAPTLTAPVVPAAAFADVRVSWSGLTHDLLGQPLVPADLDLATLLVARDTTPEALLAALASDRLAMADLRILLTCTPTEAGCRLSEFGLAGNMFDPSTWFEAGSGTWLIAPGRSESPSVASLIILSPDDGAPPTAQIELAEGAASLAVDVDLRSLAPVYVAAGAPPRVDWSALTMDALGNAVDRSRFDQLYLARFDRSLADLEASFLALESLAEETWELDVTGEVDADLAALDAAPVLDPASTWLLALRCSTCRNPAPRFLTVLVPLESP